MRIVKSSILTLGVLGILGVGAFIGLGQYSKNGSAPGLNNGSLAPCPDSPNCVSSEAGTARDKQIEPLTLETWDALPDAIAAMGGTVTQQDENYIAAEFTSATFGFVDDLELRLTDTDVQVRSASRVGYSDRGVNAARVAELRETLAQ